MLTEAQKRAKSTYRKKLNNMRIEFYPSEADIFEHIRKQENKQGYIKNLVRQDMERGE